MNQLFSLFFFIISKLIHYVKEGLITKKILTPLSKEDAASLEAGERVLLSGTVYTARDAAHKRLVALAEQGKPFPFQIEGAVIYYVGPAPAPPGKIIGSAGPTTSCRMDAYAPVLLDMGLLGMIGKGNRSPEVVSNMVKNGAVYFAAIGGAAALIAKHITSVEVIAYEDLGTEAVQKLTVDGLPVIVAIDSKGKSIYEEGPKEYLLQNRT